MKIDEAEIRRRLKIAQEDFAKKLKEQRERLRMSARELGEVFGVNPVAVWSWENRGVIPYCGMAIVLQVVEDMEPRKIGSTFGQGNRPPRYSKEESEKFIALFKGQRKSLGLTFEKVAKILKVSHAAPYHWESGISHPTKLTWEYILETLESHSAERTT